MCILLVISSLFPTAIIELPDNYTSFQIYDRDIFCAPFNGKYIVKIDSTRSVSNFLITNQENSRIYDFKITPFFFYLNMLTGIMRVSISSGLVDTIYSGDVTAFVVTPADEIVLAESRKNELIFLDVNSNRRFSKKNAMVVDMDYYENKIYVLRGNEIAVFDSYGNTLESIRVSEKVSRIVVDREIFLFSPMSNVVFKRGEEWQRIELDYSIIDLKLSKDKIWVLKQYGDTICVYNRADF